MGYGDAVFADGEGVPLTVYAVGRVVESITACRTAHKRWVAASTKVLMYSPGSSLVGADCWRQSSTKAITATTKANHRHDQRGPR